MAAAFAIIGLLRRHPQQFADEREVEIQQKCSVKEQEIFAAALGVAGEFRSANRQIGVAAHGDCGCGLRTEDSIAARFRRMMNWLAMAMLWSGPSSVMGRTSV